MKLPFEWLKSIADCCSGEAAICKMERQLLELKTAAPIVDWPITNESNGNLWGEGGGARRVGPGQKRWSGNLFWFAAWSCVGKQYCPESRGGNEKKETFALLTQYSAETPAVGAGMIHRGSREQTATDTLPPERIYWFHFQSFHQHRVQGNFLIWIFEIRIYWNLNLFKFEFI